MPLTSRPFLTIADVCMPYRLYKRIYAMYHFRNKNEGKSSQNRKLIFKKSVDYSFIFQLDCVFHLLVYFLLERSYISSGHTFGLYRV